MLSTKLKPTSNNPKVKSCRILIAENDRATVQVMTYKLKKMGITPDVSFDGEDALNKLRSDHYRLVILDIRIPKLDGYQLIREIKKDPNLQRVKICVITNLGREETFENISKLGVDEFFIKANVSFGDFVSKITELCGVD